MKGLTKRQLEILNFVRDFIANNEFSPSYREIMEHFGFTSLGSVYKHMNVLKRKGVIVADKNSARSIALAEPAFRRPAVHSIELPFLGYIAAGPAIEAFPQAGSVNVPSRFAPTKGASYYVLQVRGESMIGNGIHHGDMIVVESRATASPGETVVALIGGRETTLKRFYQEGDQVRLEASNPHYKPIVVSAGEVSIQGVLRGLLRSYQ